MSQCEGGCRKGAAPCPKGSREGAAPCPGPAWQCRAHDPGTSEVLEGRGCFPAAVPTIVWRFFLSVSAAQGGPCGKGA